MNKTQDCKDKSDHGRVIHYIWDFRRHRCKRHRRKERKIKTKKRRQAALRRRRERERRRQAEERRRKAKEAAARKKNKGCRKVWNSVVRRKIRECWDKDFENWVHSPLKKKKDKISQQEDIDLKSFMESSFELDKKKKSMVKKVTKKRKQKINLDDLLDFNDKKKDKDTDGFW